MNIFENISSAISSVFSNKMRTFLTMLGIIIGVSSVITITALGKGFEKSISKTFEILNSKAIQLGVNWGADLTAKDKIFVDDIEKVKEHPNVKYVSGLTAISSRVKLKNPNEQDFLSLMACNVDFSKMQKNFFKMSYGRIFSEQENEAKAKVCIIGEGTAFNIFGRKDVVGEDITLIIDGKEYEFKVVGVNIEEDKEITGGSKVFIPINTVLDILDSKEVGTLYIEAKDTSNLKRTENEIIRILAANHNTTDDKYLAQSNMEAVGMINKVIKLFTIFIGFVAGISLFVGGIGVMNIMLVTVTERTKEIGIRKSLGATDRNIKTQFMIEAMFICALGGIVGIIVGFGMAMSLGSILNTFFQQATSIKMEAPVLSIPVALGSMVISTLVGIVFGVYPASKAAKLNPIDALRYE